MARATVEAALAVTVVWLSGCGTVANANWRTHEEGAMKMYGGVKMDIAAGREGAAQAARPESLSSFAEGVGVAALCALDLPLSAVGDTLTLPVAFVSEFAESMIQGDMDPRAPRPAPPGPVIAAFPYRVSAAPPDHQ